QRTPDDPAQAISDVVDAAGVIGRERQLLGAGRTAQHERGGHDGRQDARRETLRGQGMNRVRSMASAIRRYPASLGWRWSPVSAHGSRREGAAGSRRAASKSMTASNAPLSRIH